MAVIELSPGYKFLQREPGPLILLKGLEIYGLQEIVGARDNPIIMGWAKEIGVDKVYTKDEVAWCGLVHYTLHKRTGKIIPFTAIEGLWALNWVKFGIAVDVAMLGDTLVFKRKLPTGGTAGHVGTYVGHDPTHYHVMGGNEGNAFQIVRIARDRCVGIRRPNYKIQPENVRPIFMTSTGIVSTNES